MNKYLVVLLILVSAAVAQDSLPWHGAIVFEDRVRVDDAPGLSGHPAIHPQTIMAEDWSLYTVWEDDRDNDGQFDVYFSYSRDTGKTWSRPNTSLSRSPTLPNAYPWLVVDANDLYVVWQSWHGNSWELLLVRSTDAGNTWTAPVEVPGITVVNDFNSGINFGPQPKLAIDSRSSPDTVFLYLLWADNATGKIQIKLARSIDLGASFADLGIVDKNPDNVNRNPYLVVDDQGWVHCAWARGTSGSNQDPHPWIGYSRSRDRGATFLAQDVIVNDDESGVYRGNPSLTYNAGNGNILISWEDSRRASGNSNPDILFSRMPRDSFAFARNQRANIWGPDTSITFENYKPVIRMDPNGIMVAAWHSNPGRDSAFGIYLAAYSDSAGRFGTSQSLLHTVTGTSGGNFGNAFYAPSLFVRQLVDSAGRDTSTRLFLVWQDFSEDVTGGNIYSVRGKVVRMLGDIDVDNDSLEVRNDTLRARPERIGRPYIPFSIGRFVLANTTPSYNPDPEDGPSLSWVDSLQYSGSLAGTRGNLDSIVIYGFPTFLDTGQVAICTLSVYVPAGTPDGDYSGMITITGRDANSVLVQETFYALVRIIGDLDVDDDSLDVSGGVIDLRVQPAGPVYSPYAKAAFVLVNTSPGYNPDPEDGPSLSPIRDIEFHGSISSPQTEIDSIFILNLPESLQVGESRICTLALVIPVGTLDADFAGRITIDGFDSLGYLIQESFEVRVIGPRYRASLDSLRVAPNPFKPGRNPEHTLVHFQGLSRAARVFVYDASGLCVWKANETGDGHVEWDARVASGIYAYLVVSETGQVRTGKLSVQR